MLLVILALFSLFSNYFSTTYSNEIKQNITMKSQLVLFDFTKDNIIDWTEQSDTRREVGMSKAVFVTQKTEVFKRAILFTLLNPQPNGAAFAGIRIKKHFNLSQYNYLLLKLRAQGENVNYKIVLRHKELNDEPNVSYEVFFSAPFKNFDSVILPLQAFKPYYRGKPVDNAEPLDTANITCFGIQIFGGVYSNFKQSGSSTLEIDWIKAFS